MRIAVVGTRGYPHVYSGYETFVAELAPRLVQRGHEVTVYCHSALFPRKPRSVDGVHLVYLPALEHKILSQFSHSLLATFHVALNRFDAALYVNAANGPFGVVLRATRTPSAINVDGLEWLRPKWKGVGSRYFRWAARQATRFFDAIVTDAHAMAEVYRHEFQTQSMTIEYGAEPAYSTEPERVRQFGVKPGQYYLIVGRLVPDNNADLLVRGFQMSATRRRLLVVGGVPYRDNFADRIRSVADDRILFPGYVRDQETLKELYCNAYAYLHGHEFGGTNPSLLRALAAGAYVAALDTPFNRETLEDTRLGIYFDKRVESVSSVITTIDTNWDLVESHRAAARRRVIEYYNWTRITDQYELLLSSLAEGRTASVVR